MTADAGTPRERIPRRKRIPDAQILDAAVAEFVGAGYQAARVDVIAQTAKVTKRTLYVRFESKEVLFRAALRRETEELAGRLFTAYEATPTPSSLLDRLHEYVQAYFDYARDRPEGLRLLFLDETAFDELALERPIVDRISQLAAISTGFAQPTSAHTLIAELIVAVTHNGAGSAVSRGQPLDEAAVITERFLAHALTGMLADDQRLREAAGLHPPST